MTGDNLSNERRDISRNMRKEAGLSDRKNIENETKRKNKSIRGIYRGIDEFKKDY
jgi:hypothetical protein